MMLKIGLQHLALLIHQLLQLIIIGCGYAEIFLDLSLLLNDPASIHLIRDVAQYQWLVNAARLHGLNSHLNATIGIKCWHLAHINVLVGMNFIGLIRYRALVFILLCIFCPVLGSL